MSIKFEIVASKLSDNIYIMRVDVIKSSVVCDQTMRFLLEYRYVNNTVLVSKKEQAALFKFCNNDVTVADALREHAKKVLTKSL